MVETLVGAGDFWCAVSPGEDVYYARKVRIFTHSWTGPREETLSTISGARCWLLLEDLRAHALRLLDRYLGIAPALYYSEVGPTALRKEYSQGDRKHFWISRLEIQWSRVHDEETERLRILEQGLAV